MPTLLLCITNNILILDHLHADHVAMVSFVPVSPMEPGPIIVPSLKPINQALNCYQSLLLTPPADVYATVSAPPRVELQMRAAGNVVDWSECVTLPSCLSGCVI